MGSNKIRGATNFKKFYRFLTQNLLYFRKWEEEYVQEEEFKYFLAGTRRVIQIPSIFLNPNPGVLEALWNY